MSAFNNNALIGSSGQGGDYTIARSLRFRSSASAFLNRTPASAGNRRTWTYSAWVKLGVTTDNGVIFEQYSGNSFTSLQYTSSNTLIFWAYVPFNYNYRWTSAAVFRDPSAWYHVVVVCDTTQASTSNAVKLYINGVQQTFTYSFADGGYSQNVEFLINSTGTANIGKYNFGSVYYDGYITEINFIDGQQLTPSSFGENNEDTGVWQPKKYAGTYGTNGFYLPFSDNASTTTLGNDFSGNGNNWTVNNISLTAGSTYDSMTDVPTLTSATAANFAVLNPLVVTSTRTISDGNLSVSISALNTNVFGSMQIPTSGKWYWEFQITAIGGGGNPMGGVAEGFTTTTTTASFYRTNGNLSENGGDVIGYGATYGTSDIIGVAANADSGTVTWYKNGVSQGARSFNPAGLFPALRSNAATDAFVINFGQRPFAYTPPTGFQSLNTFNLPTPTIGATASTQANKYFDVTLYTGNGATNPSSQAIVNAGGFQPDFVWIKSRSNAYPNFVWDAIRGVANNAYLVTNDAAAQNSDATGNQLSSFNSNGFSVQNTTGGSVGTNNNGSTFVGWQWNAGGSTVTNTSGSISSQVRANTSAGFSVVTWTGAGSTGTIGHGLGVAPNFIILKRTNSAVNWYVGGSNIASAGNGTWSSVIEGLNTTGAVNTGATAVFNSTAPTSTVFTGGSELTSNGGTYVAYCFAAVPGYSAFGRYTGNGSTNGTFIFTGFRPRYIMVKRTDSTANWTVYDTSRSPYNQVELHLRPNTSQADDTGTSEAVDILSNGFKLRGTSTQTNVSGGTYIYMAFAENPFKYSLAR